MGRNRSDSKQVLLAFVALCLFNTPAPAQPIHDALAGVRKADVLLLGTFHFDDPGLDDYKPRFPWNPLDSRRQQEITQVVGLLAAFRPTRVALEWPIGRQADLDSAYSAFLSGRAPLGVNEREQLGFRLAHELGHTRVYAVDAPARSYYPDMTEEEYERHVARLLEGADGRVLARQQDLEGRFRNLAEVDDSLKTIMHLRDYLLRENDPDRVLTGHGQYLIGSFYLGREDDYLGPDMRTRWYNRNLRIFHNLQRITASTDERIIVLIGSGHLPILRHSVQASPEYRLVEVRDYLGRE
jgi:hypothetical protein